MSCEGRPTADTDPGECRWCLEWATGGGDCPYHGERVRRMQDGTRVRDAVTGRIGTVQIGWATGAVSIVWDDDPGVAEHYYEGELEVIEGGAA